jgi:hypothetical protein
MVLATSVALHKLQADMLDETGPCMTGKPRLLCKVLQKVSKDSGMGVAQAVES